MRAAAIVVVGLFFTLGLVIILANYQLLFKRLASKPGARLPSMVPIAGGLLCALSLHAYFQLETLPKSTWSWHALWPLALDPGGVVFFAAELGAVVAWQNLRKLSAGAGRRKQSMR